MNARGIVRALTAERHARGAFGKRIALEDVPS